MNDGEQGFLRTCEILAMLPYGKGPLGLTVSEIHERLHRKGLGLEKRSIYRQLHELKSQIRIEVSTTLDGRQRWKRSLGLAPISTGADALGTAGCDGGEAVGEDGAGTEAASVPDFASSIVFDR
ncbi:MAG: hypothetical protein ACNA7J_06270 [Wenzhouxiangella sp.]